MFRYMEIREGVIVVRGEWTVAEMLVGPTVADCFANNMT